MTQNEDFLQDAKIISELKISASGFGSLVDKYQNLVYRYLLTCTGNIADAEDLTQEVFVKVYESISRIDTSKPFRHYLLTITRNTYLNFKQRQRTERKVLALHTTKENEKPSAKGDHELALALQKLSESEHALISMRYFEGLDCKNIGHILGISPNAVSIQLYRVKAKLKTILETQQNESK